MYKTITITIVFSREMTSKKMQWIMLNSILLTFTKNKAASSCKASALANSLFAPSDSVLELAEVLRRSAGVDPENSIGICYRGTDKKIEIDIAPIERYIEIASAILDMHGEQLQILIQTDQIQARDTVVKAFGNRTKFIAHLPATKWGYCYS